VKYVTDENFDGGQPTAYGLAKEIAGLLQEQGFETDAHSNAAELTVEHRSLPSRRRYRIRIDQVK
jgi:hypothetical protein